ncbi:uncharacterized protein LOC102801071 [Saccoglossus kowalevskii]|uniref:Uncharacterized protein LOC102801071 n=1 Tax=Saccoglossus kowalevskii TaxID=10224 RepID=A0ABM0M198_SACKO|nr:PREDICTED: uncharacterized protein LOC102801071 [Saccoglossus kowalevskii]
MAVISICRLGSSITTCLTVVCLILSTTGRRVYALEDCEDEVDGRLVYNACIAELESLNTLPAKSVVVDPSDGTCGTGSTPSHYCPLVGSTTSCPLICMQQIPEWSFPPANVFDQQKDQATSWQSVSWTDYPVPLEINVTISLGTQYELQDDVKITFQSGLPRKMILEKSMDYGNTWETYQYFSNDCLSDFEMPHTTNFTDATQVTCTQDYSTLNTEFGEDAIFAVTDRLLMLAGPTGADFQNIFVNLEQNEEFTNFLTLTDLRIRLLEPAHIDGNFSDEDLKKYYYSISNVNMPLRCKCNMHGQYCQVNETGHVSCVCKHNTEGRQCEKCKAQYDIRPWQTGSYLPYPDGTANECRDCMCNGHSNECHIVSDELSCANCQHNTIGAHCEECLPGYYRDLSKNLSDPEVCSALISSLTPASPSLHIASSILTSAAVVPSLISPSPTPDLKISMTNSLIQPTPSLQSAGFASRTNFPTPSLTSPTVAATDVPVTTDVPAIIPTASTNGVVRTSHLSGNGGSPEPCDGEPCENGGICKRNDVVGEPRIKCECSEGYTGYYCEDEINECASNPCVDGMKCLDLVNNYTCVPLPTAGDASITSDTEEDESMSEMMVIVIAVCCVAVIFCIAWTVFFAWYTMLDRAGNRTLTLPKFKNPLKNSPMQKYYKDKKSDKQNGDQSQTTEVSSHDHMGKKALRVPLIPDRLSSVKMHALQAKWHIGEEDLDIGRLLDNGEFCYVKEGQYKRKDDSEVKVAVKQLKDHTNEYAKRELLNEFEILAHMGLDPNIILLHGICNKVQEFSTKYCLVTEYVSNGSLLKYIRRCRSRKRDEAPKQSIPPQELVNIMVDVAHGMKYLHNHKILHRKLMASNILITFNNRAKICDFGLATDMYEHGEYVATNEPVRRSIRRWLAYESLLEGVFSAKSDVWSYGIVLWEVSTLGSIPYPGVSIRRLPEKLKEHYRMEKPKHVLQEFYDTMLRCWHRRPESRPSFDLLCKEMKNIQKNGKAQIVLKDYTFVHYYSLKETPDSDVENDSFV